MRSNSSERALEVLGDYLFELETKGRPDGRKYGTNRSVRAKPKPIQAPAPAAFDIQQEQMANEWENDQLRKWRKNGRMTDDGRLRVSTEPLKPYTMCDISQVMGHLGILDRVAALIDLDGVVERGFMKKKEHENIRSVVEQIADQRVMVQLQSAEMGIVIEDRIRDVVADIFKEVLEQFQAPVSILGGHKSKGRQNRCSRCKVPGHRATTCGKNKIDLNSPIIEEPAEGIPEHAEA